MITIPIHSRPHLEMDVFPSPYDEVLVSLVVVGMATFFVLIGKEVNTDNSDVWKGMWTQYKIICSFLKCLICRNCLTSTLSSL